MSQMPSEENGKINDTAKCHRKFELGKPVSDY